MKNAKQRMQTRQERVDFCLASRLILQRNKVDKKHTHFEIFFSSSVSTLTWFELFTNKDLNI